MVKRFLLVALSLILVVSAAPFALADADCDTNASHYARAVQLHDMGDFTRALRHYNCALAEDPDNPTIPVLIENLHEDIASASNAWSADASTCDSARDHSRLGQNAYAQGDNGTAQLHLQCALLANPDNAEAAELMGHIHINRGSTHTAKYYYDRAAAARAATAEKAPDQQGFVMPDWLTPYEVVPAAAQPEPAPAPFQPIVIFTQRSQLLRQTDTTLIIRDGDTLTYWRRLQSLYVERVQVLVSTGEVTLTLFSQRVYAMSREARLTIQLPPPQDSQEPGLGFADYIDFANWFSKRGEWQRAAKSLERALELQPYHDDLRCRLGLVYQALGDDSAALAQFDHVISRDPSNICANENRRAVLRAANADVQKAVPAPQAASPAQPIVERAMSFRSANKLFAAANTLIEALAVDSAHSQARCELAKIYSDWSNYGRALREFERILDRQPGNACAIGGRLATIENMLSMVVPLVVEDFFYHAREFLRIEAWSQARDAFERGLAFDPTRSDMRCQLGMVYAQLGDDRSALAQFDRVLANNSLDACARSNRDALMQSLRGD
ncbi:MAG: tetratricopeptide repeat protein [Chloroflexi bacterium]|nr:tetratricopeptide repeat protein [Chloroflexota bacterium]